jgi:methylated-DNA-protein-cysteine methyltransferase-like protein
MPPDEQRRRRIVDVIVALQPGEVVTYGDIAEVAGYPRQSRLVGRILATTELELPWWRVVNVAGRLVPGHERTQARLLRQEDVVVRNGHVRTAPHGRFAVANLPTGRRGSARTPA